MVQARLNGFLPDSYAGEQAPPIVVGEPPAFEYRQPYPPVEIADARQLQSVARSEAEFFAENGFVLRNIPTVSKPISVGGTILVPYIGAGFGGGYATELDRSLNTAQSASSGSLNTGLKNLFGPQLIPNEVQLGVRFPF